MKRGEVITAEYLNALANGGGAPPEHALASRGQIPPTDFTVPFLYVWRDSEKQRYFAVVQLRGKRFEVALPPRYESAFSVAMLPYASSFNVVAPYCFDILMFIVPFCGKETSSIKFKGWYPEQMSVAIAASAKRTGETWEIETFNRGWYCGCRANAFERFE